MRIKQSTLSSVDDPHLSGILLTGKYYLAGFSGWFLLAGFSLMYRKISQNRTQGMTVKRRDPLLSDVGIATSEPEGNAEQ